MLKQELEGGIGNVSIDNSSMIFVQRGAEEMGVVGLRKLFFFVRWEAIAGCLHDHENDSIEKEKSVMLER